VSEVNAGDRGVLNIVGAADDAPEAIVLDVEVPNTIVDAGMALMVLVG